MNFAKWVYRIAGIYGLLVLAPLLFLELTVSQIAPPAITHLEYYYGFAISRVAGGIAHIFEQKQQSRIIRPESQYVGPRDRRWIPLEQR